MAEALRTQTNTQIRNLYSEGLSYLNISFYNLNLSFKFHPFLQRDANRRSIYDTKNGLNTTVNFEGAYSLYEASKNIIEGKEGSEGTTLIIPCKEAELKFERTIGQNNQMETIFSITKNNTTIPFKFETINKQVIVNGQLINKVVESGLGAFMKTIEGYLTGINADRHLDKMTDDYVKLINQNNNQDSNKNRNYDNGNGYKKQYGNNNGYKKQNNYNNQRNNNNWQQQNQQDMSSYNIQN